MTHALTSPVRFDGAVPKTLRTVGLKYADRVREITGIGVLAENEYDVSYRAGWKSSTDPIGALHSDTGRTVRDLTGWIRDAIPCDCDDCAADMKAGTR